MTGAAAIQGHATACTSMIAGYDAVNPTARKTGLAYGAGLWTGNIATSYGTGGSFFVTTNSTFTAYYRALVSGIDGQTADIASSSYGDTTTDVPTQQRLASGLPIIDPDDTQSDYLAVAIDSIVSRSNKLVVIAAGNNGGNGNADLRTVGAPASGNNGLVVGASGNNPTYNARASFSAYGPNPYNAATGLQTGNIQTNVNRARVDILAPGVSITGATTGSGFTTGNGTSFATPIVAGGAGLVESAAKSLGYASAVDNRVVIAILQNSADQLAGWSNATHLATVDGFSNVSFTDQALDFQQGAGQMNLSRAYDQLTAGTHDVVGNGGGYVQATGWDLGALATSASNDYTMNLLGGTVFSSTLRFNGGATFGTLSAGGDVDRDQLGYTYLSDFEIGLYSGSGAGATLLAQSNARYITSEHFLFDVGSTGLYTLRVTRLGDRYDFDTLGGHSLVGYGLAWSGVQAVPEPASFVAVGLGVCAVLRRRRKVA